MSTIFFFLCISAAAGLCNGFFGSGGGILWVFGFAKKGAGKIRYRLALRLACLCSVLSVLLCLKKTAFSALFVPSLLLPALAGGVGGSFCLRKLRGVWIHRLFALLLFFAGAWMLCSKGGA